MDATVAAPRQAITLSAFIHHAFPDGPKVFLARRADDEAFLPGAFEIPGGHVEPGEDIVAALRREIMEELSMTIEVGAPFHAYTYGDGIGHPHTVEVVYLCRFAGSIDRIALDPAEHSEARWAGREEAGALIEGTRPAGGSGAEAMSLSWHVVMAGFDALVKGEGT